MKLTKILKEYILQEVGESVKGYDWSLDDEVGDIYSNDGFREYSFLLNDKEQTVYSVIVVNSSGFLNVEFQIASDFDSAYRVINKGVQFKIMGTIVNIIKNIVDHDWDNSIKGVMYSPVYKEGEKNSSNSSTLGKSQDSKDAINQRDSLYRAYIKKAFPDKELKFTNKVNSRTGNSIIKVEFPKQEEELNEVGDSKEGYPLTRIPGSGINSPEAPLRDYRDEVEYTFEDDEGNKYRIEMYLNTYSRLDVDFNERGTLNYNVTNRGKQFKIMATVANAIENEIELDYWGTIQGIEYVPAYEDKDWEKIDKKRSQGQAVGGDSPINQRDMLYRAFIAKRLKNLFPNATVKSKTSGTVVNFNREENDSREEELNEVGESREGYQLSSRILVSGLDNRDAPLRDYRDTVKYKFKDDDGNEYYIELYLNLDNYMDVSFAEVDSIDYSVTNRGKQFKIMATVANAIEKEIDLDYWGTIQGIEYVPAYTDKDWKKIDKKTQAGKKVGGDEPRNRRDALYRAFIAKRIVDLFPNAEVSSEVGGTKVSFNREPEYDETLNEVGESIEGYPFTLDYEDGDIYEPYGYREYGFRDKDDDDYGVEIRNRRGYLHVDFGNYSTLDSYGETNKGEQFKIMGTVVAILKSILKGDTRNQIKGIEYIPTYKSDQSTFSRNKDAEGPINQRDAFYRAYIKRAFPGANLKFSNDQSLIKVDFPKS